jgi:hypothetical protein
LQNNENLQGLACLGTIGTFYYRPFQTPGTNRQKPIGPEYRQACEISLTFTSSSGITTLFIAEEMFEALIHTTIQFSTNPNNPLQAPEYLLAMERKTLDEGGIHVDRELSSNVQGLCREGLVYFDVLT